MVESSVVRMVEDREPGRVVVVWGGKGGVGCTLVAAGLARLWHRQGRAVAAVQAGGSVCGALELLLARTEVPLLALEEPSRGGAPSLEQSVAAVGPQGRVVVDCGSRESPLMQRVMSRADVVAVVGTPDLLGLRSLTRGRRRVLAQGLEERRSGYVLNRLGMPGGLGLEEVQALLTSECWGILPDVPEEVVSLIAEGVAGPGSGSWSAALEALATRIEQLLSTLPPLPRPVNASRTPPPAPVPLPCQAKQAILQKLVRRLGEFDRSGDPAVLRRRVTEEAAAVVEETVETRRLPRRDVDAIILQLVDEVLGLGALEDLIRDPEVTEIMINGPAHVYVEKGGRIQQVPCHFASPEDIIRLVDRIIGPLGRRIDESSPMVDARLPDGSRLNAVIPPLALDGPLVTIRRFGVAAMTMDDLVAAGTLAPGLARQLKQAVVAKKNILLSGGTGTGKTTLLNALSGFIPSTERIITIEDAAELRLQQQHVVRLEARPPNVEGLGAVTIRDLVRNALRMRPDRIIVGEVRGAEALDMLQAMNTGHSGSMATIHANSAADALSRLETMTLMANVALPLKVVRDQIAAAVDFVVHLERQPDGSRRVTEVVRLSGTSAGRYQTRRCSGEEEEGAEPEVAEA